MRNKRITIKPDWEAYAAHGMKAEYYICTDCDLAEIPAWSLIEHFRSVHFMEYCTTTITEHGIELPLRDRQQERTKPGIERMTVATQPPPTPKSKERGQ